LCGGPPFMAQGFGDIMVQHITQPPEPPQTRNQMIPDYLQQQILRALSKRPDERHASMADLCTALSAPQATIVRAPGVSSPREPVRSKGTTPMFSVPGDASTAPPAAGDMGAPRAPRAATTFSSSVGQVHGAPERMSQRRRRRLVLAAAGVAAVAAAAVVAVVVVRGRSGGDAGEGATAGRERALTVPATKTLADGPAVNAEAGGGAGKAGPPAVPVGGNEPIVNDTAGNAATVKDDRQDKQAQANDPAAPAAANGPVNIAGASRAGAARPDAGASATAPAGATRPRGPSTGRTASSSSSSGARGSETRPRSGRPRTPSLPPPDDEAPIKF